MTSTVREPSGYVDPESDSQTGWKNESRCRCDVSMLIGHWRSWKSPTSGDNAVKATWNWQLMALKGWEGWIMWLRRSFAKSSFWFWQHLSEKLGVLKTTQCTWQGQWKLGKTARQKRYSTKCKKYTQKVQGADRIWYLLSTQHFIPQPYVLFMKFHCRFLSACQSLW